MKGLDRRKQWLLGRIKLSEEDSEERRIWRNKVVYVYKCKCSCRYKCTHVLIGMCMCICVCVYVRISPVTCIVTRPYTRIEREEAGKGG